MLKHPSEQFQIGERVVYQPEGIVAQIAGYVWHEPMDSLPTVASYVLSCGISAPASALARADEVLGSRRTVSGLREPRRFTL